MQAKVRTGRVITMRNVLAGILCCLAACGCITGERLGVNLDEPLFWHNQNGERFVARYGSLSDNSLAFVKITLPDGEEVTLPRALSASGARYTDGRQFVWWEHQGTVRIDIRRDDGTWDENHWELRPDPQAP